VFSDCRGRLGADGRKRHEAREYCRVPAALGNRTRVESIDCGPTSIDLDWTGRCRQRQPGHGRRDEGVDHGCAPKRFAFVVCSAPRETDSGRIIGRSRGVRLSAAIRGRSLPILQFPPIPKRWFKIGLTIFSGQPLVGSNRKRRPCSLENCRQKRGIQRGTLRRYCSYSAPNCFCSVGSS
jgi:hypothetical protein